MTVHRCVAVALVVVSLIINVQSFTVQSSFTTSRPRISFRNLKLQQHRHNDEVGANSSSSSRRRRLLGSIISAVPAVSSLLLPSTLHAAPPIAIIAEELGYFPVTNRDGNTVYVSKRVSRKSSDQAIRLAQHLRDSHVVMFGAYWCPHCARQKELFGREAWSLISYVECAPNGYGANVKLCRTVNGFPEWKLPKSSKRNEISGEVPLSVLAEASNFAGFDETKEVNLPPLVGGSACK